LLQVREDDYNTKLLKIVDSCRGRNWE